MRARMFQKPTLFSVSHCAIGLTHRRFEPARPAAFHAGIELHNCDRTPFERRRLQVLLGDGPVEDVPEARQQAVRAHLATLGTRTAAPRRLLLAPPEDR